MQRKKVGIFTGYFLPHMGGVERYTEKLTFALEKLGYNVVIITTNSNDMPSVERQAFHTIYRLPIYNVVKNRYPLLKMNREYRKLKELIVAENIDFYITNTRFHLTSLVGARIGRAAHKPVLLIEHGTDHFTVGNRFLDFFGSIYEHLLTNIIKCYVTRFYGVSRRCNEWSKHFGIRARGVFYNAIDLTDEANVTSYYSDVYGGGEVIITYAGRLIKEKGVLNLLDAFVRLKSKHSDLNVRLVVAGDGALLSEINKLYGSNQSIDVLGRIDFARVMSLYKATDIFIYPSLYPEGLPTSILEAGLMGCAVIATDRGGTLEVITDEEHGIIVDGSVGQIYDAMKLLVTDKKLRNRQAANLKLRVKQYFNWDAVASEVDVEMKNLGKL